MVFRRPRGTPTPPFAPGLTAIDGDVLERLMTPSEDAAGLAARIELAQSLRGMLGAASHELDGALLGRLDTLGTRLGRLAEIQSELKDLLERYQVGPWHPAVFLGTVPTTPTRVLVLQGGARRVVGLVHEMTVESLAVGDEVYLDDERGLVVGKSAVGIPPSTETAAFERVLPGDRILLRFREELVVVEPAATLSIAALAPGDLVRWDSATGLAYERIEPHADTRFLLADVPGLTRDSVGGQDDNLARLLDALTATLVDPARALRYRLGARRTILMIGPPGGGKTLMARIAAAEIARLAGTRMHFAVVKPAELDSMWVGESERAVRRLFASLRDAARGGHAVLFLDEVEALGRLRGGMGGRHDDKLLAALLAEIDGFADCEGVAIIAATNRKELVDPALLERLSDVEIRVGRPTMAGARRIFEIHLPAELPYADGAAARGGLIDHAVSRLYAPNGDNGLARLTFRDGTVRPIAARDLLSGRVIAQVCRDVCAGAFRHDLRFGEVGITLGDVDEAVAAVLLKLATTLTPRNCRAYLDDLPQDLDVVSVEPLVRRVPRRHHYVNAA